MKERGRWQGMLTIARFNWPFYAGALFVLAISCWAVFRFESIAGNLLGGLGMAAALYFLLGSLGVSHLVYDRSDLYRWRWLERALRGADRNDVIFCHSGFDEASATLQARTRAEHFVVLDHYDVSRMTERSIQRARRLFPPVAGTLAAAFDRWPVAPDSFDLIFGILAIHELRSESERIAWFGEARRVLRDGGRIVLAEHLRDWANFLAFGPGFLHFHSRRSWHHCWKQAGWSLTDEFEVTPWVRIFVLERR